MSRPESLPPLDVDSCSDPADTPAALRAGQAALVAEIASARAWDERRATA